MGAVVHPVLATGIRAQPAAEPVAGLQQEHVAAAQAPGRGESRDPAADHHDIASLVLPKCIQEITTRASKLELFA